MKLSFNYSDIKNGQLGFSLEECLTEEEATKVKNLDLDNLTKIDRKERLDVLKSVISEGKADMVNAHLEHDFILVNQKNSLIKVFDEEDFDSRWKDKVNKKILNLEEALDTKELNDFVSELIHLKYGVGLGLMNLHQAEKILYNEYAEFLQSNSYRFGTIFPIDPPVSFFPYHPKYIKEAILITKDYLKNKGDFSKIKIIENTEPHLWYVKEDKECIIRLLNDKKWRKLSFKLVSEFQDNPNQKSYISRFLNEQSIDSIDFERLDIDTAEKLAKVIGLYFGDSYLLLNIIFDKRVPESLLPFSKIKLLKLINFLIEYYKSISKTKEVDAYIFSRDCILEEYIDTKIAMTEFFDKIKNEDVVDCMVSDLKNYQFEKIKKLLNEY